jgi:hypothetical protein
MRERNREPAMPQPQPRQLTFDTTTADGREGFEKSWNDWADQRIRAHNREQSRELVALVGDCIGKVHRQLRDEIAALRREITGLRNQIEQRRSVERSIARWHVNRRAFTLTPFGPDGRAGKPINLRPMFEEYHAQTS